MGWGILTLFIQVGTMKDLMIRVPDEVAEALKLAAMEINLRFRDNWTEETLAASLLRHVLEDDAKAEGHHLRVVK
jgi:hypothetical protein